MQALPRTLEDGRPGELTRGFIELVGADGLLADALIGHFCSGTRWGPDSLYYSKMRDRARAWLTPMKSTQVREWVGRLISTLSDIINRPQIDEERQF